MAHIHKAPHYFSPPHPYKTYYTYIHTWELLCVFLYVLPASCCFCNCSESKEAAAKLKYKYTTSTHSAKFSIPLIHKVCVRSASALKASAMVSHHQRCVSKEIHAWIANCIPSKQSSQNIFVICLWQGGDFEHISCEIMWNLSKGLTLVKSTVRKNANSWKIVNALLFLILVLWSVIVTFLQCINNGAG